MRVKTLGSPALKPCSTQTFSWILTQRGRGPSKDRLTPPGQAWPGALRLPVCVCVCVCVFMYLSLNCIAVDCIYLIPASLLRSLPPQVAGVGELAGALCETLCSQPGPPLQRRTQENTHQRQQRDEDCIPALLLSPRPRPPCDMHHCLLLSPWVRTTSCLVWSSLYFSLYSSSSFILLLHVFLLLLLLLLCFFLFIIIIIFFIFFFLLLLL